MAEILGREAVMIIRKATIDDIRAINELFWELDTDAINDQPEHFQRGARTVEYLSDRKSVV